MTATQQQIERLRALLAKATPGPWADPDLDTDSVEALTALRNSADALIECVDTLQKIKPLLAEFRDAFARGSLTCTDGHCALRSNLCIEADVAARAALAKLEGK